MTLQNKLTRLQNPSRIINYVSPPAQYKLYVLIHGLYETLIGIKEKKAIQDVRYQSNLVPNEIMRNPLRYRFDVPKTLGYFN